MRFEDGEEGERDGHCPNNEDHGAQKLDQQLFAMCDRNEPRLSVEKPDSKCAPEAVDSEDEEGLLGVVYFAFEQQLGTQTV